MLCPVIIISGCNSPPPPPKMKPPAVTVAEPVQKTVVFNQDFTGTLASVASVDIRARVDGILEKVNFEPSATVKKGQLLFEIQRDQYQAILDKANAQLAASNAQLKDAQVTLERNQLLLKKQAVTPQDVDDAEAARDKAQAAVMAAKADIEQATINLNYTRINAPITGEIGRNLVDAGNLVGSGENTLLTTIVTMDPIYVYFDASERLLLEALKNRKKVDEKITLTVYVGLSNEEGYPHKGELDYADNKVDPGTGTIQLRAIFKNPKGLLYPGVYVRVRVPGSPIPGALLVHDVAIGTDLAGKYLLIVGKDNIVEKRQIEIGQVQDNLRVVLKGLKPGEKYIYEGLQRARPGRPVEIKNQPPQSTAQQQKQTNPAKTAGAPKTEKAKPKPASDSQ
ncbi:efflux RND transporter periplasmic adaptor subunit [Gimesia alba]|uniref:efflux RND transporter periplasmic adaptor subunit n=1 Tax=Gimesia alba TaxID=2527973 RepID=UPI0018D6116C|nr:efflux RND transporter periplasmic adaptor subunit [Gimesia alba]